MKLNACDMNKSLAQADGHGVRDPPAGDPDGFVKGLSFLS